MAVEVSHLLGDHVCLGMAFESSLGKYGRERSSSLGFQPAWLKCMAHPVGLPAHTPLGPDPTVEVLGSVPGADKGHLVKHHSSKAVCLFSLYLKKFQEMWLQSSGLPLSPASLPAAAGHARVARGQVTSGLGLGQSRCSGWRWGVGGVPSADFPAVSSSISFPATFLRSRIFWNEGNYFVLLRKLCRRLGSR